MTVLLLTFLGMSILIVLAGSLLARSADRIAESIGMGRTLAGLVLLAIATSLPELSVGLSAVRLGAVDLTAGGLLGSSLINLLILALLDLFTRTRGRMLSRDAGAHALSATASMLMTGMVLLAMLLGWQWTVSRIGPGSLLILLAWLFSLRLIYFDQQFAAQLAEPRVSKQRRLGPPVAVYVLSACVILVAAPRLCHSAESLAEMSGLGQTFFGTVFLAMVTSMPEAVTTLAAIRLGSPDMAVGNIFGSNAFNMLILALLDGATPLPLLSVVSPTHAITAVMVILVTAVATLGLLYRAEKRWWIIEPDAALVALLVFVALALVYAQ